MTGLSTLELFDSFPFDVTFGRDLLVGEAGSEWVRLLPELAKGGRIDSFVEVVAPAISCTFEALRAHTSEPITLYCRALDLTIEGRLRLDSTGQALTFMGPPAVGEVPDEVFEPDDPQLSGVPIPPAFARRYPAASSPEGRERRLAPGNVDPAARPGGHSPIVPAYPGRGSEAPAAGVRDQTPVVVRRLHASPERRGEALLTLSRVLADAASGMDAALPRALQIIGELLGWEVVTFWYAPARRHDLQCRYIWQNPSLGSTHFANITREAALARGAGIPGMVWTTAQPICIADIAASPNGSRLAAAVADRLHACYAFPVMVSQVVMGVVEAFGRAPAEPDADMRDTLAAMGGMLGDFLHQCHEADALKSSERRTRRVLESALDAVVVTDADGAIVVWNAMAEAMFGWERPEALGRSVAELIIAPSRRDHYRRCLTQLSAAGAKSTLNFRVETDAVHRNGNEIPVEIAVVALTSRADEHSSGGGASDGDEDGYNLFIRDISDRRQAEANQRSSHEQLQFVLNATRQGLWDTDLDTGVTSVGEEYGRILGYVPSEFRESAGTQRTRVHPDDVAAYAAATSDLLEGRRDELRVEYRARTRDGGWKWVRLVGRVVDCRADGTPRRVAGTLSDITGERTAQAALEKAQAVAEASTRSRMDFVSIMSHEIRSPLNGINGVLGLLQRSGLSDAQQELVSIGIKSVALLTSVADEILEFSRAESRALVASDVPFALAELADDAIGLARTQAAPDVEVMLEFVPARPSVVRGDPARVRQILDHLLANAVKFTRSGFVRLVVTSQSDDGATTEHIRFAVEDTGTGIPPEKQVAIFTPFTQADAFSTRRHRGAGLGLPIAARLARLLGGSIQLQRSTPEGSVFELNLPFQRSAAAALPPKLVAARPLLKGHLLVVDDSRVNLLVAGSFARMLGCTWDSVTDGPSALDRVAQVHYDLVLMDCQMPDMDGYEVTRQIRDRGFGKVALPIIALTASALADDREHCLTAGMNDHLVKPFNEEQLAAALRRWLPCQEPAASGDADDREPRLDVSKLQRVRETLGAEAPAWQAMVGALATRGDAVLLTLNRAIDEGAQTLVRQSAREMRSTADLIGATYLVRLCEQLEDAALTNRSDVGPGLATRIRHEFQAVLDELRGHRKTAPA